MESKLNAERILSALRALELKVDQNHKTNSDDIDEQNKKIDAVIKDVKSLTSFLDKYKSIGLAIIGVSGFIGIIIANVAKIKEFGKAFFAAL